MKKTDTVIKIVSVLALLAIICYIGYYIYDAKTNPLRTVAAMDYTVTDTAATEGYIVRTEEQLTGDRSHTEILAEEGEKLAAGGAYAIRFDSGESMGVMDRIRALDTRIGWLESIVAGGDGAADRMARESVADLAYGIDRGDSKSLQGLIGDVKVKVFQSDTYSDENLLSSLEDARNERSGLEKELDSYVERLTVPRSGVFTTYADGFEHVTSADLEDITPDALEELFKTAGEKDEALGKLVTDIRWRYAAIMDEKDASKLRVGSTVTFELPREYNRTLSMTVEDRGDPHMGRCVVIFVSGRDLADTLNMRQLSADLVLKRVTGIRVPLKAMHREEKEITDDKGKTSTEVVNYIYVISGVQAERVDVTVLSEYEDYCLVEADGLRAGMEVVVEAKELYSGKVVR